MPVSLSFRSACVDDIPALLELVDSAYRGDASRAGWTSEADLLDGQRTDADELSALITRASGETRIVLGSEGGALVCSALLAGGLDTAYVGMISVRPTLQGRGVGAALLAEIERCVRTEQLGTRLRMTVIAQRAELIAWYERRGFRATGAREPFPYGDARFGLPRRDDLYFVVLEKPVARSAF